MAEEDIQETTPNPEGGELTAVAEPLQHPLPPHG